MQVNETLLAGDLKFLVSSVIEIDSYKSKIGDDSKMIVVSFNVDTKEPADDLARFLELGYDWVVDADVSSGEMDDGDFLVFAECDREPSAAEEIIKRNAKKVLAIFGDAGLSISQKRKNAFFIRRGIK